MARKLEWLWPPLVDEETARKASRQGVWASAYCAGATIIIVLLNSAGANLFGVDIWSLADAFLFVIIGYGIYKLNRAASIAGLILYVIERISMWSEYGAKNPVIAIFIILMYVNSVRGVFSYRKYVNIGSSDVIAG